MTQDVFPQIPPARSPSPQGAGDLNAFELRKNYGATPALAGVTLQVPKGQTVAIMGPSGSGKSTLLNVMSGILKPDSGQVFLGPHQITSMSDAKRSELRRKQFGFVFQDGQLLPELPARENVALPLLLNGLARTQALSAADMWLQRLGLAALRDRQPGEMSGGQAQRVAIARALVHAPSVVFADEPTGALDQVTGDEVMQILTGAAKEAGASLLLVTHDPKVAAWCDRVVEIRDAQIHSDRPAHGDGQ